MQKVYDSYDKLKDSYREVLTEEDIRECFQNDSIKTEMKKEINKSIRRYLVVWGVFLVILLIAVEYMSNAPAILPRAKLLWRIIKKH